MKMPFREILRERVLLADGAMGTELYARGFFVNRSYDELNLTAPETILRIHEQYAESGAEILTTNTFGANRILLSAFGLADRTVEINRRGVELARQAAGEAVYVAGSMGPISDKFCRGTDEQHIRDAVKEQALALIESGVDFILLETFTSLEQLEQVYQVVREVNHETPIIPSVSLHIFDEPHAISAAQLVKTVREWGSQFLGLNCGGGPPEMLEVLPLVIGEAGSDLKVSVMPNAGLPKSVEGRTLYLASPEYMAEYTRRFVQIGAAIVGGCCGTTPQMIKEMRSFLRSVQPGKTVSVTMLETRDTDQSMPPIPLEERTAFGKILGKKFAVSVELDPPKGIDAEKAVQGAKFLYEHGIDAVNIADGPRATGRMSPTALATLVKREVPIETIIHVCCRDRNLLALQMDLISANALGLQNLMLITGDPPKMGIYPDSTAVFDLDSIGLVTCTNLLNRGLDFARRPLNGQTSFVLGVGCNPGATDLEREIRRYEQKVEAGAEFVFSQPVYDNALLENFLKRTAHVRPIPFFVGILPLASYKNAEFLHNEVPGMQIPEEIRERMRLAQTRDAQRNEGMQIAAEVLREARRLPQVQGAYIFPPFGKYERIMDVLELAGV
ncbi:MAG TPA: bifunctional homocysteine S-methyltransferase/methylenetetrahydrofolate reductase [bacterium]|nr:bifunctional homocysteine S-methyltransferase/methylenetetrahydrofolate reductase [bacterium]